MNKIQKAAEITPLSPIGGTFMWDRISEVLRCRFIAHHKQQLTICYVSLWLDRVTCHGVRTYNFAAFLSFHEIKRK